MDIFKIYTSKTISSAGIPTVIVTAGQYNPERFAPDYWFAEYFILIPNDNCEFF
jgi:hypothetical protein